MTATRPRAAGPIAKPFALCLLLPLLLLIGLGATRQAPLLLTPPDSVDRAVPVTPRDTFRARRAAARRVVRRLEAEVARSGNGRISPMDLQVLRGMLHDAPEER